MEVIRVDNLSKLYDLGQVGTGTLSKDLNRWWARARGKQDPYARLGQTNDRTKKAGKDDSVWAINDINFSINQGDVVGVIGRNGAGKSTLLKIISRITTPTKGTVKIKGRIASLLEVGTGFHPEMTGRENIFMNGTLLGMTRKEIQKKLDEIIDFAGVALYIDTPVKRYSSGMQVRLAFAVGAFLEPEILIVDEVLAVGDAEFQKKAIGKMQDVSKSQGRTVLFVSHNMAAIENLCHRCILLKNGMVLNDARTNDVIKLYLSNAVKATNDLSNIEGRQGIGKLRFTDIKLLDGLGNAFESLRSGKRAVLRIGYKCQPGSNLDDFRFSLAIGRDTQPLIVMSSELTIRYRISLKDVGFIDFIVDDFPLSQGNYDLTLFAEASKDIQDWFTLDKYLQVIDGDFFGGGVNYPVGWQGKTVLVRHKLEFN